MNRNILFFCTICEEKSKKEFADIRCTIEHSIKTFKRGEYIVHQGDIVSNLYILSKGKVKTEMVSDSGITIPIEDISAPYPLAAAFIFAEDNHFPVDVVALDDCDILLISKGAVEEQITKCPGFLRGFMKFNADRMQFLSERLKIFSQKGIKAKIAYYIMQRVVQDSFDIGRSMMSLADYFGVERPSLSRAFSHMCHDGIIEFKDGIGKIINHEKFKELLH